MFALYAFNRVTDDLSDEPGELERKHAALCRWRSQLDAALGGVYSHRCHAALHHVVHAFGIPPNHLYAVIDGCETDLEPIRFECFESLRMYCYRVASAVGLACVRIWGVKPGATFEQAEPFAEAAGYAFQLTNVLRDLGEDRDRGRVYLPTEELARFDCPPESWSEKSKQFRSLMRFQMDRARDFYRQSEPLAELLSPEGRTVFTLMRDAYRGLLARIEAAGYDVFTRRVRLSRWQKLRLLGRTAWPWR
jgi:phytoene synthase